MQKACMTLVQPLVMIGRQSCSLREQEPPKKRGRPFKQEASQALVVSPNRAAPKKKQSMKKSVSQCSPIEFRNSILDAKKMNDIVDLEELKLIQDRIKKVAEDIDWQCVLKILPVKLKKQLSLFLIGCFHEEQDRFIINGVPIDMKPLVHPVLGLSCSGNKVDLSSSRKVDLSSSGDKTHDEHRQMYDVFTRSDGRPMYAKDGLRYLTKDEDVVVFTLCFVLEAMAFIFGPKTNRYLEREYLQWFHKLVDLKNLNLCEFIADLLCREIKKFKASTATFKKCGGCLLLPVINGRKGFPAPII
ncbi:hypothetical protein CFC21_108267 [Triticum aestivum]|uniref:Uncharacterized protein n=2 Tax=Triticum aestivum TaxID=4565 RepID=A0A3B6TNH1_WHEAT|nr:hypothetical protein CFC21_108267 [Triticum aestivum]